MAVDLLGGVFSDLSLVFKPKFDVIAGVAYSAVVVGLINIPFGFKLSFSLNLRRFWTA